jgi:hypothetical protein
MRYFCSDRVLDKRWIRKKRPCQARAAGRLDTLVLVNHIIPPPLLVAREAVNEAQALREKDKDNALKRLGLHGRS